MKTHTASVFCYNIFEKGVECMSPSMLKMWISISAMGFMVISILLIYLSRYKINIGVLKFITALIAYILLILSGIIILFVVMSGPTS